MRVAIYCRVSTIDQNPEKQLFDCREYCRNRGFEIVKEFQEKISGFKKNIYRDNYEAVKVLVKAHEIQGVVVWALDRWVRNRDTLLDDVLVLRNYGCKLFSVKESWLEAINIEGAIGKTIQEFLLGLIGSIAEMESQRRSERTRMAYLNKIGRWGRKSINLSVIDEVCKLYQKKLSMRDISKQVYYYDKSNNKRFISVGLVHKIIKKFKGV